MARCWMIAGAIAFGSGCFLFDSGEKAQQAAEQAEAAMREGDLPAAAQLYADGLAKHPRSVDLATGAAFMALLEGEPERADQLLQQVEPHAEDRLPEVQLRRALVAMRAGNLDLVKELGLASKIPVGSLLAAEVLLMDGEREEAAAVLQTISKEPGQVGATAQAYLDLIQDEDPLVAGLSEAQAMWALGSDKSRQIAVRSVEELVKSLSDDETRDHQLLLWAGRAATVGEVEVARSLLDAGFPPEDQVWRKYATEAIVACAAGEVESCLEQFEKLENSSVPLDGLADARATAALLVAEVDADAAKTLAGPYLTDGAARALHQAGAPKEAWEASRSDMFAEFLRPGG